MESLEKTASDSFSGTTSCTGSPSEKTFSSPLSSYSRIRSSSTASSVASSSVYKLSSTSRPSSASSRSNHNNSKTTVARKNSSSSQMKYNRLLPSKVVDMEEKITGETQFTKPAQGALRMNKFVQRLHNALKNEAGNNKVSFNKGCLILHCTETFAVDILPKYFKTSNFKTFRRQLNYYGFVHARSYPNETGDCKGTTALWVNQVS